MIQVDIYRRKGMLKLYAHGHAGYAEVGKDIVCAGVSALLYAFSFYLVKQGRLCDGRASVEVLEDGGMEMVICPFEGKDIAAFEVIKGGLELLAQEYPMHIRCVDNSMNEKEKEDETWKM